MTVFHPKYTFQLKTVHQMYQTHGENGSCRTSHHQFHTGARDRHQTGRTAAFSTVASPLWCMPIMQAARSTKSDEKARRTLFCDDIARCGITKFTYTSERDRHQNGSDSRPLDGCRPPDGLSMWTVHQDSPLSPSRQSIDAMNRLIHEGCVP